jgi:hypothetical protein
MVWIGDLEKGNPEPEGATFPKPEGSVTEERFRRKPFAEPFGAESPRPSRRR